MLGDGGLSLREFVLREPLPLAGIHTAVLEFLQGRSDAAIFGAQAVNAYVDEPRMTQDVDILSTRAVALADELKEHLVARFHIAVRIREVAQGRGLRLFQVRKPKNRHLVDVRPVAVLPPVERIDNILVVTPAELIASKVIAYQGRRGTPKSGTDWRDLALLLLTFPELKSDPRPVEERLNAAGATPSIVAAWHDLRSQVILEQDEDEDI